MDSHLCHRPPTQSLTELCFDKSLEKLNYKEDKRIILPVKLCQLYFFFSSRRCGKKWFSPNSYSFNILSAIDSAVGSATRPTLLSGTRSGRPPTFVTSIGFSK